jgi:hypothetical protein
MMFKKKILCKCYNELYKIMPDTYPLINKYIAFGLHKLGIEETCEEKFCSSKCSGEMDFNIFCERSNADKMKMLYYFLKGKYTK